VTVTRRGLGLVVACGLGGCPYVPTGEIRILDGAIGPGASIQLGLFCDSVFGGAELAAGGAACEDGAWGVFDGTCVGEWWECSDAGDELRGRITACGVYTTPVSLPAESPVVVASEGACGLGGYDGCSASLTITIGDL
jgi:hypothetical protein